MKVHMDFSRYWNQQNAYDVVNKRGEVVAQLDSIPWGFVIPDVSLSSEKVEPKTRRPRQKKSK
jgi:hypothetical protein